MSGASFFSGAKNVVITGGTFNNVQGNYHVVDQSRKITNINSFNSNNTTTLNSHNDYSVISFGRNPRNRKSKLRNGQGRSAPQVEEAPQEDADGEMASYFPSPVMHPMLQAQQADMAYSNGPLDISNVDSYNVKNQRIRDSNNDNSERYGSSPRTRRREKASRHRRKASEDDNSNTDEQRSHAVDHAEDMPAHGAQRKTNKAVQQIVHSQLRESIANQSSVSENGTYSRSISRAQYQPHEIQPIVDPIMMQTMDQLMAMVKQQTSQFDPDSDIDDQSHSAQDETGSGNEEGDEGGSAGSEEEEEEEEEEYIDAESPGTDDEDVRMSYLPTDMANLSLNGEPPTPYSGSNLGSRSQPTVPHISGHFSQTSTSSSAFPGPDIPSQSRQSLHADIPRPPSFSMFHRQHAPPPTASSQSQGQYKDNASSDKAAFDFGGATINGSPNMNIVYGNYECVDRSSRVLNVNSGNTANTLVKDSNNDNSIRVTTIQTRRKLGRILRP